MTVRLRSDRHPLFGPGFALLVFDRPIDAPRLDISILNSVTGLYLGPSLPGRPNWGKQRTTFFPAIRAGGEGSSIFRVGPEVTTYIQEGTYVEIASLDGRVCDELSWEGVLVRSSPVGTEDWTCRAEAFELSPDGLAAGNAGQPFASENLEKARRDEREADRRRQQEEERLRAEHAATAAALAERQAEEEKRRRAKDAAFQREQEEARLRAARIAATALAQQQAEAKEARRAEEAAAAQRAREETIRAELQEGNRLRAEQEAEWTGQAKQPVGKDGEGLAKEAAVQGGQEEAPRREQQEEKWIRAEQAAAAAALAKQRAEERTRRGILVSAMLAAITVGGYVIYQAGYLCSRFDLACSGPRVDSNIPIAKAQGNDSGLPSPSPDVTAEEPSRMNAAPNENAPSPKRDNHAAPPTMYYGHIDSYSLRICNHLPQAKSLGVIAVLPTGDGTDLWWIDRSHTHTTIAPTRCADFGGKSVLSGASFLSVAYVRAVIGEPSYTNPKNDKTIDPLPQSETATFCIGSSVLKGGLPGEHCNDLFERPAEFWKVSLREGRTTVDITNLTTVSVTYARSASGQKKGSRRSRN